MARDPEFADPSWSKVLHQVQGKHGEMLSLADVG